MYKQSTILQRVAMFIMPESPLALRVLVVDDEMGICRMLQMVLQDAGFEADIALSLSDAVASWESHDYQLVIIDKNLPDGSGHDLVRRVAESDRVCETVMISGYANLESAVEAFRMGVADYLVKPFHDVDAVLERFRRAANRLTIKLQNRALLEEIKAKNEQLEELVVRDGLTKLYNHAYFQERLEAEVQRGDRHGRVFGMVFFDIDRFKEINDRLGHQVGDAVLKEVADVLRGSTGADPACGFRLRENDLAARYGGDEFVLILPETPKAGSALKAERLRQTVENQSLAGLPTGHVTISVGVAAFPEDGTGRRAMISAADAALYAAKRTGRNRVMSYTPRLTPSSLPAAAESEPAPVADEPGAEAAGRLLLALERSIHERSFGAVFQPIVNARSFDVLGYEALGRPLDASFASIREAIATAEHAGLIPPLGRLLREVSRHPIERLPPTCNLFVNLHPFELFDTRLLDAHAADTPPTATVVYEITNSCAVLDSQQSCRSIRNLRAAGHLIALDDFLPTYGALDKLANVKADFLKMNLRSLEGIRDDRRRMRVLTHIMEVAASESIRTIAVGAETAEHVRFARDLGFGFLQGFYFGKGEHAFATVNAAPVP